MLLLATAFRISLLVSLISRKIAAGNGLSYTDNLIINSGSMNTWISANYKPTSTSVNMHQHMEMKYDNEGTFTGMTYKDIISHHIHTYMLGTLYTDTLTLSAGVVIHQ